MKSHVKGDTILLLVEYTVQSGIHSVSHFFEITILRVVTFDFSEGTHLFWGEAVQQTMGLDKLGRELDRILCSGRDHADCRQTARRLC